ncbi:hypothetical protein [Zooshikella harenae]|uniref:Uncharacterized protein n=1 Tax=Zooshikella harenae TaxID=2827238 RepID=A0ABS5ZJT7_9GAMM|nr:hypothetical protein [Zooshikella harenae]MBU2714287.1 hypothetical protein [Zooshikella harenae]
MDENINLVKLSIQRALLGEVSSFLRAVVFSINNKDIEIRFYFDGVINEEDRESASCVETEVIADYDEDYSINANCLRVDACDPINDRGVWVYKRRE